jgi:hypothetical protein
MLETIKNLIASWSDNELDEVVADEPQLDKVARYYERITKKSVGDVSRWEIVAVTLKGNEIVRGLPPYTRPYAPAQEAVELIKQPKRAFLILRITPLGVKVPFYRFDPRLTPDRQMLDDGELGEWFWGEVELCLWLQGIVDDYGRIMRGMDDLARAALARERVRVRQIEQERDAAQERIKKAEEYFRKQKATAPVGEPPLWEDDYYQP